MDLSKFEDNTFIELYASHILEHFDHSKEVDIVLAEWFRVLAPSGRAYIAVPDLSVLARLFAQKSKLTMDELLFLLCMLYGGQTDEYDVHKSGFNWDFLSAFLKRAGFTNCKKVKEFGLYHDTSTFKFKEVPISLNVVAEKPNV